MHNLALFRPWKSCWPVSGPEPSRVLLCTVGPATFHTSRWACVSTRPHARAKLPKAPRLSCRADVLVFLGETRIRWQFPKGDL